MAHDDEAFFLSLFETASLSVSNRVLFGEHIPQGRPLLLNYAREDASQNERNGEEGRVNVILLSVPLFLANSFRKLRDRRVSLPLLPPRMAQSLLSQFPDFPREFRLTFRTSIRLRIPSEKSLPSREAAFKLLASARGERVASVKSA